MITSFKMFESKDYPQIGDLVLIHIDPAPEIKFSKFRTANDIKNTKIFDINMEKQMEFINNNIGEIIDVKVINSLLVNKNKPMVISPTTGNPTWNKSGTKVDIIVTVKYSNMPDDIEDFINKNSNKKERGGKYCLRYDYDHIVAFGKTEEEVRLKAHIKKFNV